MSDYNIIMETIVSIIIVSAIFAAIVCRLIEEHKQSQKRQLILSRAKKHTWKKTQ